MEVNDIPAADEQATELNAGRNGVQVISRAAQILRALQREPDGLSLAQISRRVGLPRSTVHRIVNALSSERFVVQGDDGVRLGFALSQLGAAARNGVRDELRPYLFRLSRELDETVDLAVQEHDRVLIVSQAPASHRLAALSFVGANFPIHCTANGKAMLAEMADGDIVGLLPARLEKLTPCTIQNRAQLISELQVVRRDGVAFDREEHTTGICAVGAVVRRSGEAVAAVTVPLPAVRFYGHETRLAAVVIAAAHEMTDALAEFA